MASELSKGGYLVSPRVAVQVSQFRPYYILGKSRSQVLTRTLQA